MRLVLALLAVVVVGLFSVVSATELDDGGVHQERLPHHTNRSQPIEIRTGQVFSISLPSGPQDHWQLAEPLNEGVVKLVEIHVESPSAASTQAEARREGHASASAIKSQVWIFMAVGEGITEIALVNVISGQNDVPQGPPFRVIATG